MKRPLARGGAARGGRGAGPGLQTEGRDISYAAFCQSLNYEWVY